MKERNFIIKITNFDTGNILNDLSGKSLRSSGSESPIHENDSLLCYDILDTRDSHWQRLAYIALSISYHHYVRFSHVVH